MWQTVLNLLYISNVLFSSISLHTPPDTVFLVTHLEVWDKLSMELSEYITLLLSELSYVFPIWCAFVEAEAHSSLI